MRTTHRSSHHRYALTLAFAALFASPVAEAALTPHPLDAGPVASLRNADLLEETAAPDSLKPGEFQLLPSWHAASAAPAMMMVSLKDQRAYVYRDGELIAYTTVSTGRPGYDTWPGVYQILEKKKVHHSNKYKDNRGRPAAMPFMQRLTWDGYALHAGRVMAKPASHGCVRLPPEFAKQLFQVTQRGGTVVISRDGSVYSLAKAGVDMQLAVMINSANSVLRFADALVADDGAEPRDQSAGGVQSTAFNP